MFTTLLNSPPLKGFCRFLIRWVRGKPDASLGPLNEPCLHSRKLLGLPGGWALELHCFVGEDDYLEFHSHPYDAYRLILLGGYREELWANTHQSGARTYKEFKAGSYGKVTVDFYHRIDAVYPDEKAQGVLTAWLHGPRTAQTKFRTRFEAN